MSRGSLVLIRLAALMLLAGPTVAFAQEAQVRLTPVEITALGQQGAGAGTSGVAGIQSTILSGDPTKPGPYTIEIRVPAHTRIAAHDHRDERSAVVVSGEWYLGYGKVANEAALKLLPPGSFYTEPAGDAHFAMTLDAPAVVYISGFGPTSTTYVDAANAPLP
ncbi:MAG: cupin domain-containing protein [Cypionkella sp.]